MQGSATASRVGDSRARARSADIVLRAVAAGDVQLSIDLLLAVARVADRIAIDLALVDQDMAMENLQ